MQPNHIMPSLPVHDDDEAITWWTALLGRGPDRRPMDGTAEWAAAADVVRLSRSGAGRDRGGPHDPLDVVGGLEWPVEAESWDRSAAERIEGVVVAESSAQRAGVVEVFGVRPGRAELWAVVAGAVAGVIAAYSYYNDPWRDLAHTLVIGIVLAIAASVRQPPVTAVVRASLALVVAAVTFEVGKDALYAVRYGDMPYSVNSSVLGAMCLYGVIGGVVLGLLGAHCSREGWRGAGAMAAIVGLFVASTARRVGRFPEGHGVLITVTALAVLLVVGLGYRSREQLVRVAALLVPALLLGYLIAASPDALEQLVFVEL